MPKLKFSTFIDLSITNGWEILTVHLVSLIQMSNDDDSNNNICWIFFYVPYSKYFTCFSFKGNQLLGK